jgi:monoamine oxidase
MIPLQSPRERGVGKRSVPTDLIIGGAGLAGLRIGLAVLKADRTQRVIILEKEKHTGGRVATYYSSDHKIQWEMGAGRISTQHTKTLSLLKKYGLHTIPISSESDWRSKDRLPISSESDWRSNDTDITLPNPFTELCAIYLDPLNALDPHVLATHTIEQLLKKTVGPLKTSRFLALFPYHAETHTLRADLALRSFDEEMGHHEFVVCKEGLSALTEAMAAEFLERGGEIHHGITITGVQKKTNGMRVDVEHNHDIQHYKGAYEGNAVVLTMPCDVLKKITMPVLPVLPVFKHLAMEPLVRIYAVFPLQNGKAWFPQTKIVTDSLLRYIIPMNPKQGTIMISYMEGPDTDKWFHLPKEKLTKELMKEVRRLFPHLEIPEPTMVKRYPWAQGCSYWLPGDYDVEKESHASLQPDPRVPLFLAGESFAVKQCWMESALDQADHLVALPAFRIRLRI